MLKSPTKSRDGQKEMLLERVSPVSWKLQKHPHSIRLQAHEGGSGLFFRIGSQGADCSGNPWDFR